MGFHVFLLTARAFKEPLAALRHQLCCTMRRATEHDTYMQTGSVGSVNIGLPGEAVRGSKWNKHRKSLLQIFVSMLDYTDDMIGLLVCEAGSVSDPYGDDEKAKFDDLFREAFKEAAIKRGGATEHNALKIFWSNGFAAETVMVFKPHVNVTMLQSMTKMDGLNNWRRIEVAQVTGVSEKGEAVRMNIYNSHQPSSKVHNFPQSKRNRLCKHVLQHAIRTHNEQRDFIGFVCAGDANCSMTNWASAKYDENACLMHFEQPMFVYANDDIAVGKKQCKPGDTAVVMGLKGFKASQFNLRLQSREEQHDAMIVGWTWNGMVTKTQPASSNSWVTKNEKQKQNQDNEAHSILREPVETQSKTSGAAEHKQQIKSQEREILYNGDISGDEGSEKSTALESEVEWGGTTSPSNTEEDEDPPTDDSRGKWPANPSKWPAKTQLETVAEKREEEEQEVQENDREVRQGRMTTYLESDAIWVTAQLIFTLTQSLPEFADAVIKNQEDAQNAIIKTKMPADFVEQIRNLELHDTVASDVLSQAAHSLLHCKTPSKTNAGEQRCPAQTMNEPRQIHHIWEEIFNFRRLVQHDDFKAITKANDLKWIHNHWCRAWMNRNLTEVQWEKTESQRTSIFSAWLRNNYGSKSFVMAILETGLSWATRSGAAEHTGSSSNANSVVNGCVEADQRIAKFIDWLLKVVKAIDKHKHDATLEDHRRRSGYGLHKHGLNLHELHLRQQRDAARSAYEYGADLNRAIEMYKGTGKSAGKGKRDRLIDPQALQTMTYNDQWYVCEFWNGNLRQEKEAASKRYCPRSADHKRFRITGDE